MDSTDSIVPVERNIPNKIYAYFSPSDCVGTCSVQAGVPHRYIDVAYIRKDAILEWAEKKKNDVKKFGQRYNEANYYNSGCHDTIQELIDKLNSL